MKITFNYTDEDVRTLNALFFITSMIAIALFAIAQIGGLI